jgi:hypothetical protein
MMQIQLSGYSKFSSTVRLELHTDGRVIGLASIGPDEVIPREAVELSPCDAHVFMDVDGQTFVWPVTVPHGAVPFESAIEIHSRGDIERRGYSAL